MSETCTYYYKTNFEIRFLGFKIELEWIMQPYLNNLENPTCFETLLKCTYRPQTFVKSLGMDFDFAW